MNSSNLKKIFTVLMLGVVATFTTNAHTPGPDYIYECPKCSNLLKKGSNNSGNTFGSTLYSDGKMIAPMLPEFPNLTKCKKCDTILWLSEMKEVGTCDVWGEKCKKECKKADRAEFLDVTDLFRFLEMDIVKYDKEKEKIVRQRIWWSFNDRLRNNKEIFVQENDEVLWEQNCRRLIELFDTTDVNQKIMTAELHRNLREFEICMELINSLDSNFDWLIEKFKTECENGNNLLMKLR
ncbi:MAG: hypothetical protein FWC39_12145 [Bacteroidetes bacterium]|nr:hypothetical protein [Bacteroidota bacterium]